jgi:uncharacterized RDD family membrane protein YckC
MQPVDHYAPPASGPYDDAPQGDPSVSLTANLQPAGFGIRFLARFVDAIAAAIFGAIGGVIGGMTIGVLAAIGSVSAGWEQRLGEQSLAGFGLGMIASLLYHSFSEGLGGASVGKLICGLRVLRDDGRPCTVMKALGRSLAYFIDAFFFGLVAYGSMSKSPMQQRYGDKWAGTFVVKASSVPAVSYRSPVFGVLVGAIAIIVGQTIATIAKGL